MILLLGYEFLLTRLSAACQLPRLVYQLTMVTVGLDNWFTRLMLSACVGKPSVFATRDKVTVETISRSFGPAISFHERNKKVTVETISKSFGSIAW